MRLKLLLVSFLAPLFLLTQFTPASAINLFGSACPKDSAAASSPTCQQASSEGGSNNRITGTKSVINTAVTIIALITGIAAVFMIIISGIKFASSAGNPEATKSARATLTASIIGLVVVALAWTITRFIVDKVVQ